MGSNLKMINLILYWRLSLTKEGSSDTPLTVTNMMFLSIQAHYCRVGGRVRGSVRKNLVPPKMAGGVPGKPSKTPRKAV